MKVTTTTQDGWTISKFAIPTGTYLSMDEALKLCTKQERTSQFEIVQFDNMKDYVMIKYRLRNCEPCLPCGSIECHGQDCPFT